MCSPMQYQWWRTEGGGRSSREVVLQANGILGAKQPLDFCRPWFVSIMFDLFLIDFYLTFKFELLICINCRDERYSPHAYVVPWTCPPALCSPFPTLTLILFTTTASSLIMSVSFPLSLHIWGEVCNTCFSVSLLVVSVANLFHIWSLLWLWDWWVAVFILFPHFLEFMDLHLWYHWNLIFSSFQHTQFIPLVISSSHFFPLMQTPLSHFCSILFFMYFWSFETRFYSRPLVHVMETRLTPN